jgi:PAS domain S-box-containing protein
MAAGGNSDGGDQQVAETDFADIVAAEEVLPLFIEAKSGYALFTVDAKGIVDSWTPGARTVFGWSATEIVGQSFETMFTPEDRAADQPRQELSIASRDGHAPDVRWHLRKDGGRVYINGVTQRLLDESGRLSGFLKVGRDLTAQREIEAALQQSREHHRLIVENVRDYALYTLDAEGRVNSWNEGLQRLTGYEQSEIVGRHARVFYSAADRESRQPEKHLARAVAEGRLETEGWRVNKHGGTNWVHEIVTAVRDSRGELFGFAAIARDVTRQRLAQRESAERERETALLTERTRMAQELHDTLAQGFTGIKLQIELAMGCLQESPAKVEDALRHLSRASEFAKESHLESRRSIRALRSPLFDDLSLNEALEQLVHQLDGSVPVSFQCAGPPVRLPADQQKDVYRIAQEALTNAARHSQAKQILVILKQTRGQARLTVNDDGVGFAQPSGGAGFGLLGMRERAQRLDAELEIESRPRKGTMVRLTLKLS